MFSRAPLALAVAGALTLPAHASLPDSSTPTLSVKTLDASVRQFSGFDVATLPGARFAVVWAEYDGSSESRIWLRRYDERGTPEANALILASNSSDTLASPTVVADNAGTLWVSWAPPPTRTTPAALLAMRKWPWCRSIRMTPSRR